MLRKIASLALCLSLLPQLGLGESTDPKDLQRQAALTTKKAVVATNMNLSENEGKSFWPIYDNYQIELNKLNGEIEAIVMKFAVNQKDVTEQLAKELMERAMKAEQSRLYLKKATCAAVGTALGAKVAARFYQVENKIDSLVKAEVTQQVPLVK